MTAAAPLAPWPAGLCWWLFVCLLTQPTRAPRPPDPRARQRCDLERGNVSANTARRRGDLLQRFVTWVGPHLQGWSLRDLAAGHQSTLSMWVDEFVLQAYVAGWSRTLAAEAVLAVRDEFPWIRNMLGGAWRSLDTWATLEPPVSHPPCPQKLLHAMVVTALSWGWWQIFILRLSGFYVWLRPCEYLELTWGDFVLPSAHMGGK